MFDVSLGSASRIRIRPPRSSTSLRPLLDRVSKFPYPTMTNICVMTKYSKREYRAIAAWRHLVHFLSRAKVYCEKRIIQSIHSRFRANMEGDEDEIVCFLSDVPLILRQRTHFRAKFYLGMFTEKKIAPFSLFGYNRWSGRNFWDILYLLIMNV